MMKILLMNTHIASKIGIDKATRIVPIFAPPSNATYAKTNQRNIVPISLSLPIGLYSIVV